MTSALNTFVLGIVDPKFLEVPTMAFSLEIATIGALSVLSGLAFTGVAWFVLRLRSRKAVFKSLSITALLGFFLYPALQLVESAVAAIAGSESLILTCLLGVFVVSYPTAVALLTCGEDSRSRP
jgi:hypothetical protein